MNAHPMITSCALVLVSFISPFAGAQVSLSSSVPPSIGFVDISATGGTLFSGAGDDTTHAFTSTIGNDLFPAGSCFMCSNGFATSGTSGGTDYNNLPINSTSDGTLVGSAANAKVICAYWDDLFAYPAGLSSSLYWQQYNGVLIMMWKNIDHYGNAGLGAQITFEIQVFPAPPCGTSVVQILYPDVTFGGSASSFDQGASATVGYIGGAPATNAQWSYNYFSYVTNGLTLTMTGGPWTFGLAFNSPSGPGSLRAVICAGAHNGTYVLAATTFAGAFPAGWLDGVDIPIADLYSELGAGPPFVGGLDASGDYVVGPFGGLPSGLVVYAVAFNLPAGSPVPTAHSLPTSYTIP